MLSLFMAQHKQIWINKQEISKRLTLKSLRERFVELNADKSFKSFSHRLLTLQSSRDVEVKNSDSFSWVIGTDDIERLLGDDGALASRVFKCETDRAKFYCQLNGQS